MSKKLFKITLQNNKVCYAVADDPTEAYNKAREYFDSWGYWFDGDRELRAIELVADEDQYQDCGCWLFS